MQCPACQSVLQAVPAGGDEPPVYRCASCQGVWVDSNEYLQWVVGRSAPAPVELAPEHDPVSDSANAKLCPKCQRFLTRYRILPEARFQVERCATCNGVWFDQAEWEVVREHRLQDKVNLLFTQPWQARVRAVEARRAMERLYLERFGADTYERIQQMRDWLLAQPQRAALLAFLQAENPYAI